jgi:hypothetical protein
MAAREQQALAGLPGPGHEHDDEHSAGPTQRRGQAAGGVREVAVLADGPWAPRAYWRDELEAMQQASARMGYPDAHPSAVLRGYRPGALRPADESGQVTRAWHYPPAPADSAPAAAPAAGPAVAPSAEPANRTRREHRPREVGPRAPRRVLVTRSCTWTDPTTVRAALGRVWGRGDAVLVIGTCSRNTAWLAEQCWTAWGGRVEHRAVDQAGEQADDPLAAARTAVAAADEAAAHAATTPAARVDDDTTSATTSEAGWGR